MIAGISGPDGVGKTTVVSALRARTQNSTSLYLYGCVVCRRMKPRRPVLSASTRKHRPYDRIHGIVDALELMIRLALRRRRNAVVFTDRSPLDGLARHDPPRRSIARALYLRSAHRYTAIFLLDLPPERLAERDREHGDEELEAQRRRFTQWAPALRNVIRVDTTGLSPDALHERIADQLAVS